MSAEPETGPPSPTLAPARHVIAAVSIPSCITKFENEAKRKKKCVRRVCPPRRTGAPHLRLSSPFPATNRIGMYV